MRRYANSAPRAIALCDSTPTKSARRDKKKVTSLLSPSISNVKAFPSASSSKNPPHSQVLTIQILFFNSSPTASTLPTQLHHDDDEPTLAPVPSRPCTLHPRGFTITKNQKAHSHRACDKSLSRESLHFVDIDSQSTRPTREAAPRGKETKPPSSPGPIKLARHLARGPTDPQADQDVRYLDPTTSAYKNQTKPNYLMRNPAQKFQRGRGGEKERTSISCALLD